MTEFIINEQIYQRVIQDKVPKAKKFLWIATADIKDMYVSEGRKMVPFLKILSDLISKGVLVRLIHSKEPGPVFRQDFDRYTNLISSLERMLCPRIHFKAIIIDGHFAYSGSANLTGAGMGAKSKQRRNFESGIISSDEILVAQIAEQFDQLWIGSHCADCSRRQFCPEPLV